MNHPAWLDEDVRAMEATIRHEAEYKIAVTRTALNDCDSPLEQAYLLAALQIQGHAYTAELEYPARAYFTWKNSVEGVTRLEPQAPILIAGRAYRADFLYTYTSLGPVAVRRARIVVEIDGHEFHERTRAQAERDKLRDRLMAQSGYVVFRYTGSEIYRAPYRAAEEIHLYSIKLQREVLRSYGQ